MKIDAAFVLSAAGAADLPRDGLAELALVGRSNVGKSSLINALVRQRIARTSGAPGKTRLVNLYRVARGGGEPVYLVDLPGYGFARGADAPQEFAAITRMYFGPEGRAELDGPERRAGKTRPAAPTRRAFPARPAQRGALLLVDARHPGLANDIAAWRWLGSTVERTAIVATKIDKLSRAERLRAIGTNEAVFEHPVLPVSAVTGEGLDELWKLIDRLLSSNPPPRSSKPPNRTAAADREPHQHPRRKS